MKIKTYIDKYESNSLRLKELIIKKEHRVKAMLMGYGLGLLIIISPAILVYNLTLYASYQTLLIFASSMLGFIFLTISDIFYHYFLGYYCPSVKEISLKINHIINTILYFIICMIAFGIILLFMR